MAIRFEDVVIEGTNRSNDSLLEVTLFEGVKPEVKEGNPEVKTGNVYIVRASGKKSDKAGTIVLTGCTHQRNDEYLVLTSDRLGGGPSGFGGYIIYKEAIYSIALFKRV